MGTQQHQQQMMSYPHHGTSPCRFDGVQHSTLCQKRIMTPSDQAAAFQTEHSSIPLVLVPRWPILFHFALNVPSGVYVMYQKWHRDEGELSAGIKWFWPGWYRISHIVTKTAITYNAPTYNVPTSDNVFVNVNLALTFRIGPDFDSAREFVYKLGPQRLDELLSAKVDESIRGLVYTVTHNKVNDLREEFAGEMLDALRAVLSMYGVQVMNVKITDVALPSQLQERLERTTAYKTKIEEHEKAHENRLTVIRDTALQEMTTLRQTNLRRLQELNAEIQRFEIEMREMEELARGKAIVNETNARSKAEVEITRARGSEEAAKIDAQKEAEARVRRAEIESEAARTRAEEAAEVAILASKAALAAASNNAKGMVAEAEAEMKAVTSLAEKRKFELEWKRLEVMKSMAAKGRKLISGDAGAKLMQELIPTSGMSSRGG
ncbi:unnamed protein product [Ectocarpus sp. 12 AP-2014]